MWWKERHPQVPLRICKIDVAKAFKWIFIALRDLGLFATDLPATLIDLPTVVVVILVCPFGWVGSPGEFAPWSLGWKLLHQAHAPPDPRRDDPAALRSKTVVDDMVVVEPMVGARTSYSRSVAIRTAREVIHPDCVHEDKLREEGEMRESQIAWGLDTNVCTCVFASPRPKVEKLAYLVSLPCFDTGCTCVELHTVQELFGLLNHLLPTRPQYNVEMGAIAKAKEILMEGLRRAVQMPGRLRQIPRTRRIVKQFRSSQSACTFFVEQCSVLHPLCGRVLPRPGARLELGLASGEQA